MFCSTLGAGALVPSPPDGGGGGPSAAATTGDIAPMLALPLPGPFSGESNIISSDEVPGLLPGVSPVEPVVEVEEEGLLVLVLVAAVEEAEELDEDEERR